MLREPHPKKAAELLQGLLAQRAYPISRGLALDAVAAVKGYPDWNTLAAAVRKSSRPLVRKETTLALLQQTLQQAADCGLLNDIAGTVGKHDSVEDFCVGVQTYARDYAAQASAVSRQFHRTANHTGPFAVFQDGGLYDTLERFSRACEVAQLLTEVEGTVDVDIRNGGDTLVARYIDYGTTYRVFACTRPAVGYAIGEDAEMTYFGHVENAYDFLVEVVQEVVSTGGCRTWHWLEHDRCEDEGINHGRVYDPDRKPWHAVSVTQGKLVHVSGLLPADVCGRIRLLSV